MTDTPTRGRPRHAGRHAALISGALTYRGKTCSRGHAGTRYASTAACVTCAAERGQRRAAAPDPVPVPVRTTQPKVDLLLI